MKLNAKPKICFATPILEGTFSGSEQLNNRLKNLFLSLESKGYKNEYRLNTSLGELFESPGDLFSQTQHPEVLEVRQIMNSTLTSWILETSTFTKEELETDYKFEFESWFHITRFGGTKSFHNHGQCSWSMVYYVDAGNVGDKYPHGGILKVYDPRNIRQNPEDVGNLRLKPLFDYGGYSFKPENGKFVIFPGYLNHEVSTYLGESQRIMIAINCMIREKT